MSLVRSCEDYLLAILSTAIHALAYGGFLEWDDSDGRTRLQFDSLFAVVVVGQECLYKAAGGVYDVREFLHVICSGGELGLGLFGLVEERFLNLVQ